MNTWSWKHNQTLIISRTMGELFLYYANTNIFCKAKRKGLRYGEFCGINLNCTWCFWTTACISSRFINSQEDFSSYSAHFWWKLEFRGGNLHVLSKLQLCARLDINDSFNGPIVLQSALTEPSGRDHATSAAANLIPLTNRVGRRKKLAKRSIVTFVARKKDNN